jgi:hypothetical protein
MLGPRQPFDVTDLVEVDQPLFGKSGLSSVVAQVTGKSVAGVTGVFGLKAIEEVPIKARGAISSGVYGFSNGNGVQGESGSKSGSGVWGNNFGGGFGVSGTSENGIGVYGRGANLAAKFDGIVEVTGDIKVTGDFEVTRDIKVTRDIEVAGDIRLVNADCAEDFNVSEVALVEPGTVMILGEEEVLLPSNQAYDKRVAGVISGAGDYKPGIVLDKQVSQQRRLPVALLGKVYCKVDAQYGAIEVGDLLTTSLTPGHAMKANDQMKAFGAVIGKALRPLKEGQELIPILIALQ